MAATTDYPLNDKYRKDYLEALERREQGHCIDCVQAAKYNLSDPTLPRYFQIKNRILVVLTEQDWTVAERFRLETERIYAESVALTKLTELAELRGLAALRIELDDLKEKHGEDPRLYEHMTGKMANAELKEERTPDRKMMMSELLHEAIAGAAAVEGHV